MDLKIIIPIILTAITVTVTITLWIKGRSHKSLSYDIISSTSLFEQHEVSKFKIFFEDKEIKENVYLVLLKIINSGNVPIEEKDFNKDITIQTTNSKVLIAEVKETTPKNLNVDINNIGAGLVAISPLLLNSKEEMIIKLLIKSSEENPFNKDDLKVESRIVGISEITKVKKSKSKDFLLMSITVILSIVSLSLSFLGNESPNRFAYSLVLSVSFAIIISFLLGTLAKKLSRRN